MNSILTPILVWLLLSLLLRLFSFTKIFNPSASIINTLETGFEQIFIDGHKGNKIGIHKYPSINSTKKVILYIHGNAGRLNYFFPELQKLGTVYSPAYPGYSESEGKASVSSIYDMVIKTYDYLVNIEKISEKDITIFGHSLGGSSATYLASIRPNANKLIVVNTFSSIQSMSFKIYNIFSIFMNDIFNSAKNAQKVTIPVIQFALPTDQTVPFKEGQKLFTYFNPNTSKFIIMTKSTHTYLDWDLIRPEL
jgi:esterase/lipase